MKWLLVLCFLLVELETWKLFFDVALKISTSTITIILLSTVTFPNHWTIVTGLYEETHGIMQNNMFDPNLNKTFEMNIQSMTSEWYDPHNIVIPIWTLNQKAGNERYSAAEWLASNINFYGLNITSIGYNKSRPYNDIIDQFINFFTADVNPINFGAIYFDEPGKI